MNRGIWSQCVLVNCLQLLLKLKVFNAFTRHQVGETLWRCSSLWGGIQVQSLGMSRFGPLHWGSQVTC